MPCSWGRPRIAQSSAMPAAWSPAPDLPPLPDGAICAQPYAAASRCWAWPPARSFRAGRALTSRSKPPKLLPYQKPFWGGFHPQDTRKIEAKQAKTLQAAPEHGQPSRKADYGRARRPKLEARVRIELTSKGFADRSLTTWVPRQIIDRTARNPLKGST